MTLEIALVYGLLFAALAVFASDRFPIDFVAFSIMATVMVLGPILNLTPQDAISGFSNSATITVMAMFILSGAIYRTGVINDLSKRAIALAGTSSLQQLLVVMLVVGPISVFINNTAAVAILIPLVLAMARQRHRPPSKLLIPLSFTSQLAGVVTVIGTSTNILASSLMAEAGYGGFAMFDFANIGLLVLVTGVIYLLTIGRWLLPSRSSDLEVEENYRVKEFVSEVVVGEDSPLQGQSLVESRLNERFGVNVLEVRRNEQSLGLLLGDQGIQSNDVLVISADRARLLELEQAMGLKLSTGSPADPADGEAFSLLEVVIGPDSALIGGTLESTNFRNRYRLTVLAMRKHGEMIQERMGQQHLGFGDTLLLQGERSAIEQLKRERGFIITETLQNETFKREKTPIAIAIVAGVVIVAALGIPWLPILVTSVVGCVLLVVTGCLTVTELHASIRWDVIFLLAGVIPLGLAMERTGGAELLANAAVSAAEFASPLFVLYAFYIVTMILTELISNNAAVVVMVPVGIAAAAGIGIDPKALALAIMFAASTSFSTPVGYQTNTMIYGPGGYKFLDFLRVGGPLNLILAAVTPLYIYWLWGL